jgi:hypothetical protein
MWHKIINFLRKAEKFALSIILKLYRFFAFVFGKLKAFFDRSGRVFLRNFALAVAVLYVIGAVAFGLRLYKQQRTDKIDLWVSCIYPFPVANVGRSLHFSKELLFKIKWAENFAAKTQTDIPEDLPRQILDDMMSDAMIMQEASRLGVRINQKDVDQRFDIVIQEIGNEERAVEYVESYYGMTLGQLKRQAVPKIITEEIKQREFIGIKAKHILIKDDAKAAEVLQKVKDGGNFDELAKEFSEDTTTRDNGGLIADGEYFYRGSGLAQEVENALFALNKGQNSELVKSELGNHIFYIEDKTGHIDLSLDAWLEQIKNKYRNRVWI